MACGERLPFTIRMCAIEPLLSVATSFVPAYRIVVLKRLMSVEAKRKILKSFKPRVLSDKVDTLGPVFVHTFDKPTTVQATIGVPD